MLTQPKNSATRLNFAIVFLVLAVLGGAYLLMDREQPKTPQPVENTKPPSKESQTPSEIKAEVTIPQSLALDVPFTPQAPTANWDELHNEACEEASAIMANAYFNGISSLPPAIVEKEIEKLTKWQQENFGYNLSINTQEVTEMINANYDLKTELVAMNEATIKKALAENKLVLLPINGQMLGNPNFKQPGPIYHMLVITGYDEENFITNEPGTRKGLNYKYSYETLEAATGNWEPGPHEVDLKDKRIIIVSK